MNFPILLLAALIPMVVGFIWYNPKVMGTMWMEAANMTEEKIKGGNMALIFGLSFVFAFLLSIMMQAIVIHQLHLNSIFFQMEGSLEATKEYLDAQHSGWHTNFRTFKHGAFHGTIAGFLFALPILATNAMFERKGFKYVFVNGAYWIITIALMGGVICQFA
jgi:hypothetical protein